MICGHSRKDIPCEIPGFMNIGLCQLGLHR